VHEGLIEDAEAAFAAGRLAAAEASARAVLAAAPGHDRARLLLAGILAGQGRHGEVVGLLAPVLMARPGLVAAYRPLAAAQWETGAREAAVATWRGYMGLRPGDGGALVGLGTALRQIGQAEEAVAVLRRAVAMLGALGAPAVAEARMGLAEALLEALPAGGVADEALAEARRVWAAAPGAAGLLERCAKVLQHGGDHDAAEACCAAVLAIDPGRHETRMLRGMLRLVRGDFAAGWPEYEARRHAMARLGALRTPPAEPWRVPADLRGQTVRVVLEQGMGDAVQFVRYLPLLAARGARVEVVPLAPPLVPLLAAMPAVAGFVANAGAAPAPDVTLPLMSLPLAFGTRLETLPAAVPYLAAPPERAAAWQARLAAGGDARPRVGVVWWGNAGYANDARRSISLARFAPLLRRDDVAFHVLAPALRAGEAEAAGLATVHEGIGDFADTAALVAEMDLVISVDTAVAHLAGALGRPVWILLPFEPDWRWLLGRADSPWYPTARLFRQPAHGDWEGVVARVREALDARHG
jgi:tetratricopeptide (TPR) repeat protein